MIERFPERKKEVIDPHKSSPINTPEMGFSGLIKKDGLSLGIRATYRDSATGQEMVEVKERSSAPGQEFFAKALKGLLPISDVVQTKISRPLLGERTARASLILPLENVESMTESELEAYDMILLYIFKQGDVGRSAYLNHNFRTKKEHVIHEDGSKETRSKGAYYDIEFMPTFFMNPTLGARTDEFYNRVKHRVSSGMPTRAIDKFTIEHNKLSPEVRGHLKRKLREMKTQFEGEGGKEFIRAIVTSVKVPMEKLMFFPKEITSVCDSSGDPDCYINAFHTELMKRINNSIDALEAEKV